jgi:two-component system, cell cycle response regulator
MSNSSVSIPRSRFSSRCQGTMKLDNSANKKTCILIVAAQEDVREILQEAMVMAGYQCTTAASGFEALDRLHENAVDVVITDVKMPSMGGLELTGHIRKEHDADVIVMAGFSDDCTFEDIITKGASELLLKPVNISELYMRIKRVLRERTLISERNAAIQKLRESEQHFQELSITDGLTSIFNSRQFYSTLCTEIERARRYNHPLSLLMLDIDDFKKYNDAYGHLEGDKVLVRFAKVIKDCMRQSDTAYRYGGEEFAAILPVTSGGQGVNAAERVRSMLCTEVFKPSSSSSVLVTVSIGVAQYIKDEDMMVFVRRADQNLYMAKAAGKDQVCYV